MLTLTEARKRYLQDIRDREHSDTPVMAIVVNREDGPAWMPLCSTPATNWLTSCADVLALWTTGKPPHLLLLGRHPVRLTEQGNRLLDQWSGHDQ